MRIGVSILIWFVTLNSEALLADQPEIPAIENGSAEAKVIREKVYGCWIEVDGMRAGVRIPRSDRIAKQFGMEDSSTWLVVGESSRSICKGGVRVYPET